MRLEPFDSSFFDKTALFYATGETLSPMGGSSPVDPGTAVSIPVSLQPFQTTQNVAWEERRAGEASEPRSCMAWNLFSATDPGTAQGNTVVVGSLVLSARGLAIDESYGDGVLWRTQCDQVS